jgi:hypothetical protein
MLMQKLNHAEKVELWSGISIVCAVICGCLVINQMTPPAVDALVPTILPKWVLGLFVSLTLFSAINSIRHGRKAK